MQLVTDERRRALEAWAREQLGGPGVSDGVSLAPASDDASFRRYFRAPVPGGSYIFVDAPPDREDSEPVVRVAALLTGAGLNAPVIHACDLTRGFLMQTDLGDRLYLDAVREKDDRVPALYDDALRALVRMQRDCDPGTLAPYDETLLRGEMNLFTEWFLPRQLGLDAGDIPSALVEQVFSALVANAVEQPQVFVHRDYHSRNLMITETGNPGIIDFQDAVLGPVTYDLVSLLKDCYVRFPAPRVRGWVERYCAEARREGLLGDASDEQVLRWFDLMGMQRHIKVAGIFSRLNLRDGKPRYLADIPLVIDYLIDACDAYREFDAFGDWLSSVIVPRVADFSA